MDYYLSMQERKAIYSYVDRTERANTTNLEELVLAKSQDINLEITEKQKDVHKLNIQIISLEKKKQVNIKNMLEIV